MLFETHAHYDDSRYDEDRDETLEKAREAGVSHIINISSDRESIEKTLYLADNYEYVYAAIGLHPSCCEGLDEAETAEMAELAAGPKVVAVGEIGLDYHYDEPSREIQRQCFRMQIDMAKSLKLPILIHDRDAHEEILNIVKQENAGEFGGTFHAFSGSTEMAKQVLKMGFHISIGGVVTFKNAKKLVDVVQYVPLDRMLIETDCPYLAPDPFRGQRNYSGYLTYVIQKIAELKNTTFENVADITWKNATELFKIGG
ncbi:MAG: TatD family hydrolase [Eubacteriales bacterium]|nr:TatD family hydrolase [Eubacteriales bacterium]